jgi:tetratricopeptide (TPR) repeat protein
MKATQMNPQMMDAHNQLAALYLLAGDTKKSREQIEFVLSKDSTNPQSHLILSSIYMVENNIEAAISEANKALNSKQKMDAYLHLSRLYILKKDLPQAEKMLQSAIALDAKALRPRYELAIFYLRNGQKELAENEYKKITLMAPKDGNTYISLGDFYAFTNRLDDAEKQYLKALSTAPGNPLYLIHLGQFCQIRHQKDKAEGYFKQAVEKNPKNVMALVQLATYYLDDQKYDKGLVETEKILKLDPKSHEGMLLKGRIYLSKKEYDQALNQFQTYLKDNPKSPTGHYYLALTLTGRGNYQQVKNELGETIKLNPKWAEPRMLLAELILREGDAQQAIDEVQNVLKDYPNNAQAYEILGDAHLQQKNLHEASKAYQLLIKYAPNNPVGYVEMGRILFIQKKEKDAISYLDKALALHPGDVSALRFTTTYYLSKKDFKKAEDVIQKQLAVVKNAFLYDLLGDVYEVQNDMQRAEMYFKKAIEMSPDAPTPHLALAGFYMRRNAMEKAKGEYLFTLQKDPSNVPSMMTLGMICEYEKKYDEAKQYYEKLLKIDENYLPAVNNLACLIAEHGGNIDVALNLAQKAKERLPNDPNISDTLGWVYYKKNVPYTAVTYFKEANEKRPNNPMIKYHLGMAYYKMGKSDLARSELSAALKLNPNFANANEARATLSSIK